MYAAAAGIRIRLVSISHRDGFREETPVPTGFTRSYTTNKIFVDGSRFTCVCCRIMEETPRWISNLQREAPKYVPMDVWMLM